jgi:hypothetical protein
MGSNSVELMIVDVGRELFNKAKAIKAEAGRSESVYDKGRHFAYYEVISLMVQQADAFGIDLALIGLEGVDPERDLLGTSN